MKKIKILHVLQSMDIGGIETYIMNMYRSIDREKYSFDFMLWKEESSFYEDEIKSLGGKIYKIKFSKNPFANMANFKNLLENANYDVIHCHTLFYSGFFACASHFANVKTFITHIHSKSDNKKNNFTRKIYKIIMRRLILKYSNFLCACSPEAGKYVFGKTKKEVKIINDYIDTDKYLFVNNSKVEKIKRKYRIDQDDFVIGTVGRLSIEKNQIYIIKIVKKLMENQRTKRNIKCLFVGDGPERNKLEQEINELGIKDKFIFVGNVSDVENYLKCFDIFLFPSIYEGFGMALLEAQASGIKCIASDNVPKSTNMELGLVKYLSTKDENIDEWIESINNMKKRIISREKIKKRIVEKGFDVSNSIDIVERMYLGDGYEE